MVVARKDDFCARIDRLGQRLQATFQMRVAMRGRRADDLAHQLLRALRGRIARRERAYQALLLKLERFDVRRRFDVIRARLAAVDGRLRTGIDRRVHGADARFRATAARLDSLSPLAVLGRGYAVCWNADRTAIIRDASTVDSGDKVHVKLERGELDCIVTNHEGAEARGFDH
jgi:exodeoxyribonuclease VII large subunit